MEKPSKAAANLPPGVKIIAETDEFEYALVRESVAKRMAKDGWKEVPRSKSPSNRS
jgi:hypothetical protein